MAKNRLGKGLDALLGDDPPGLTPPSNRKTGHAPQNAESQSSVVRGGPAGTGGRAAADERPFTAGETSVPIDKIVFNPGQPRRRFNEETLAELAASIKRHGIIEPVVVDIPDGTDGSFLLVAGERRVRAAKLAGLPEIPAIIRSYTGEKRLETALAENIHREDLNPIEEASAYRRIMENSGLSQDEAAARIGKNRSTVANALRLLKLPVHIQESLENGGISAGHARAILSLPASADQEQLYREITAKALSVRAAEKRAAEIAGKGVTTGTGGRAAGEKNKNRDSQLKVMEEKFIEKLGTKVTISGDLRKGRIEIEYYSMDDLDRLYELLGGRADRGA